MSLLGTQVYANSSTPLWLSAGGGTVNGPLFVDGLVRSNGDLQTSSAVAFIDSSLNVNGRITANSSNLFIQGTSNIKFGQIGTGNTNTSLTISTFGANADLLTVGGTVDALALKLESTGGAPVVGSGTLSSGIATINTTASDVNSYILVSRTNLAGVPPQPTGFLRVSNKSANSFSVTSVDSTGATETGDNSSFDWLIINPA